MFETFRVAGVPGRVFGALGGVFWILILRGLGVPGLLGDVLPMLSGSLANPPAVVFSKCCRLNGLFDLTDKP